MIEPDEAIKMMKTLGYATHSPTGALKPFTFERREPRPEDVVIDILYCGICHSDIHSARNEWGWTQYLFVPGHEIVGQVRTVGGKIKNVNTAYDRTVKGDVKYRFVIDMATLKQDAV